MRPLLILAVTATTLAAREVTLTWNPQPEATSFQVWHAGSNVRLASVTANLASVTLPDATTTVWVVAWNAYGPSAPSDALVIPGVALPGSVALSLTTSASGPRFDTAFLPQASAKACFFRYRKFRAAHWQLELQQSSDLVAWATIAVFPLGDQAAELTFQLAYTLVPPGP